MLYFIPSTGNFNVGNTSYFGLTYGPKVPSAFGSDPGPLLSGLYIIGTSVPSVKTY